jgi:hypothetical protein
MHETAKRSQFLEVGAVVDRVVRQWLECGTESVCHLASFGSVLSRSRRLRRPHTLGASRQTRLSGLETTRRHRGATSHLDLPDWLRFEGVSGVFARPLLCDKEGAGGGEKWAVKKTVASAVKKPYKSVLSAFVLTIGARDALIQITVKQLSQRI